jgi:Domain of unknown function (DUF2828).
MSANQWTDINYESVPSRAMKIYSRAFARHDENGFATYKQALAKGEAKINAGTLYPYDLVKPLLLSHWSDVNFDEEITTAQWKALPDYVEKGQNVMIMADTSGSMTCNGYLPIASSISLAMYFAERNTGAWHNLFMTFESNPHLIEIDDRLSFVDKVHSVSNAPWGGSTNIEAAFRKLLDVAVKNNVPANEMVKSIVIISDMEFNYASSRRDDSFYDTIERMYHEAGYEVPGIVFWNVNSIKETFHTNANQRNTVCVSGCAATTFKNLINLIGKTPYDLMMEVLSSERYQPIVIAPITIS